MNDFSENKTERTGDRRERPVVTHKLKTGKEEKLLSLLGFAARARKLIAGTESGAGASLSRSSPGTLPRTRRSVSPTREAITRPTLS